MGTETTVFIGGYYEVTDPGAGQTVTKYYFAGVQRVAMKKTVIPQSETLTYLLGDHLGSTSLAVDASDTDFSDVVETRYKPWGEVRFTTPNKTLPTRYTYTGQYSHVNDDATGLSSAGFGLLFYNARWYDPYITQFSQPDSIIPDPYNPQAWNRYAYAFNNPVRYNDPTGHDPYWCDNAANPQKCRNNYFGAHGYGKFQNSRLILACGMYTDGACRNGIPIYSDTNGTAHVPMYYTAEEFANNGGSYIYMDYSVSGSADQYAMDIATDIKQHPKQSIYLLGHSAGANAIVGGLSILHGKDGKGDLSQIQAVALLDPYLLTGNGSSVSYPVNWNNLSNLGNQDNADALIDDGVHMWVGYSSDDSYEVSNFPRPLAPDTNAVPYLNDTHTQIAVDLAALQAIVQFFSNPSP